MVFNKQIRAVARLALLCLLTGAPVGGAKAQQSDTVELADVSVEGISGAPANNARRMLSIAQLRDQANITEAQIRYRHNAAREEIRRALEPFGYYDVDIRPQLNQKGSTFRAVYQVEPGEPVRVETLDIQIGEQQSLADAFPLKVGDVLVHARYESGKSAITRRLRELGYFDQKLVHHRVVVDRDAGTARVELRYRTGPRHRFGETTIEGAQVDPRLVRRYLRYQVGEPFDQARLNQLQRDLNDTNYFSDVLINTELARRDELRVPILVRLKPGARRAYNAGISVGTDSGIGVEFGADFRWLNERGHTLEAEGAFSQLNQRFGASYVLPDLDERATGWRFGLSREREESDSSRRTTSKAVVGRFGLLGDDWRWTAQLGVERERFRVGGEEDVTTLVVPEVTLGHKQADSIARPMRGHSWQLELRGAPGLLGSSVRFYQALGRAKWISPVGQNNRLLLGASLGTTEVNNFDRLPVSYRFFAGGDRSLRGFDYQALGPVNADGEVIGGRHLVLASAEYEHQLAPDWGGAVFVDGGNAIDAFSDDLEASLGVGVRYFSPLGPIRLDIARTLTSDTLGRHEWRLHFTVGPDL